MGYLLILAVEELLDVCNRATMRDERLHPVSRQIAKLHVVEEARHVSFAKTYLTELWPTLTDRSAPRRPSSRRSRSRNVAGLMVRPRSTRSSASTAVATSPTRTPATGHAIVADLADFTAFLGELGVIDGLQPHRMGGAGPRRLSVTGPSVGSGR